MMLDRFTQAGLVAVVALVLGACVQSPVREAGPQPVAWKEIAALAPPPADHGIAYGQDSFQFGELRLPAGAGPHPVAVVIHGGCWPGTIRWTSTAAGITDLRSYGAGDGGCNAAVSPLLGGPVDEVPERYAEASPIELLPLGVPQRLLVGVLDPIVPLEQAERYAERARADGDDVQVWQVKAAGHFDLVAPFAAAWATVERAVMDVLAVR